MKRFASYAILSVVLFFFGLLLPIILMASGYVVALTVKEYREDKENERYTKENKVQREIYRRRT